LCFNCQDEPAPTQDTEPPTDRVELATNLHAQLKAIKANLKTSTAAHRKKERQEGLKRYQAQVDKNPRQANQRIKAAGVEQPRGLPAVRHPTDKQLRTTAEGIHDALFTYYNQQAKPIRGPRTGKDDPADPTTKPQGYPGPGNAG
jgi:hypothetical protein